MHHTWSLKHAEVLKQKKADHLQQLLETAEAAARRNDMCLLYNIINRLSPKQRPDRLQLRSQDGQLLSPTEAFQTLCSYVTKTWKGPVPTLPRLPAPGVPFQEIELTHALMKTKGIKSMAPRKCPGFSLRCTAATLAGCFSMSCKAP